MNYKNIGLKGISKMSLIKKSKVMYMYSDVIPFYNNYLHYLRDWSDIITNYGSIMIVDPDGSLYEDYLLNKYNDNLIYHLQYFKNIRTKSKKTKIKHYYKKRNLGLKYIYNKRSI